jgi:adenine-specific DNA glycosylase
MLDFGALVCRKQNPKCMICPMNDFCLDWKRRRSPGKRGAA